MNSLYLIALAFILLNVLYFVQSEMKKHDKDINDTKELSKASTKMFIGAFFGFIVFFTASWLYLKWTGRFIRLGNQYAGPPGIMTCTLWGFIGLPLGSLTGLVTTRAKKDNSA